MMEFKNMGIGGVNFFIHSDPLIQIQEPDPAYRPFLGKTYKNSQNIPVNIHLELGHIPEIKNLTKTFDTGASWSMYQDGEDYLLTMNPPTFKKPIWMARFNRKIEDVTIYCGEELIQKKGNKTVILNPLRYPLDQLLLMYLLAQNSGALIHAAGIKINKKGFIFPGVSGAGKSTLSRQFIKKKEPEIYSDDRMIVRKINGNFLTFGTPWPGEEGIAVNKAMPLSGIFFLIHGTANKIKKIKPGEALEKLFHVTAIPWYDREILQKKLTFCEDVVSNVPVFEFHFFPTVDVVKFMEELEI